jgi:hypothetical protein
VLNETRGTSVVKSTQARYFRLSDFKARILSVVVLSDIKFSFDIVHIADVITKYSIVLRCYRIHVCTVS